jgi:hypothetical protein
MLDTPPKPELMTRKVVAISYPSANEVFSSALSTEFL